jgi:hypothetical protein
MLILRIFVKLPSIIFKVLNSYLLFLNRVDFANPVTFKQDV